MNTPDRGFIDQDASKEALDVRQKVENGAKLFRLGEEGNSRKGDNAQYWSTIDPRVDPEAYVKATGAYLKAADANFVETATLKEGATFVTAPAAPNKDVQDSGGAIEVVIQQGGTQGNQIIPFIHK